MVQIVEMKHKMKLLNLLTSTINYFGTKGKSDGDRRGQWIDRDEKHHCLHLKSDCHRDYGILWASIEMKARDEIGRDENASV